MKYTSNVPKNPSAGALKRKKYCILLEDNTDQRRVHHRFETGTEILFSHGASLFYQKLLLFSNYPLSNTKFDRYSYHAIPFHYQRCTGPFYVDSKPINYLAKIHADVPGVYTYFVVDETTHVSEINIKEIIRYNQEMPKIIKTLGCFVIDPKIRALDGCSITLENISVQTVLSRCLGPLNEWPDKLKFTQECGYNSVHFTPFQKYGKSKSCYSINDHFVFDPSISKKEINDQFLPTLKTLKSKFNCLIVDIVLNHTSNDCPIIKKHPHSYYNLENSPHLRPAFIVDRALFHLSERIIKNNGNDLKINDGNDLKKVESLLRNDVFIEIRLIEYFIVDIEKTVKDFIKYMKEGYYRSISHNNDDIQIIQDPEYVRLGCTVDFGCVYNKFLKHLPEINDETLEQAGSWLSDHLRYLNQSKYQVVVDLQNEIVNNVLGQISYEFVDSKGPRRTSITRDKPLTTSYFTIYIDDYTPTSVEKDEDLTHGPNSKFIIAHQGWVINSSTTDFCSPESEVYIRRQLIAWGDCAKIRWGNSRSDSPYIWEYMENYAALMAKYFDGFRLDNCHSTPIHVIENIVDHCRKINPNLILIGELFTDSEYEDNLFVNRIGLNFLIRERMSAFNLKELCHIVHRFGGKAIGSFLKGQEEVTFVEPKIARAIMMDMTHDNPCMFERFSPLEYCPTAAFVAMSVCPIGSVRGFDELVPHQVSVVDENRLYLSWEGNRSDDAGQDEKLRNYDQGQGILDLRICLNKFHQELQSGGYDQIYIDQLTPTIVSVTRFNPEKAESYVMISNHVFYHTEQNLLKISSVDQAIDKPCGTDWQYPAVYIPGLIEEIFLEAFMYQIDGEDVTQNNSFICGSRSYKVKMNRHLKINDSKMVTHSIINEHDITNMKTQIGLSNFPPGSIIIFKITLHETHKNNIKNIRNHINRIHSQLNSVLHKKESIYDQNLHGITFSSINDILFKSKEEECDDFLTPIYNVPNLGELLYQGLYGLEIVFSKIRQTNDIGHPLCQNLRDGYWLMDHILNRIRHRSINPQFVELLESLFELCKYLPNFLVPCYFEASNREIINLLVNFAFSRMNQKLLDYDHFVRKLCLSTFALVGGLRNCKPPRVPHKVIQQLPAYVDPEITMSAGLPHFSCSWSRVWGRDIFLSLPGLLIIPGRVAEAKLMILSIASTARHGLIPNLISSMGAAPRYNSRDSTWFFLYGIKQYVQLTSDSNILSEKVYRVFRTDDSDADLVQDEDTVPLNVIIQEIMQRHYSGIDFIERDAGEKIDSSMKEEGFHITCGVDPDTGFLFGGGRWNCGTWMDKMGSSEKAKNKGFPATPRDGSCVELVGLFSAILKWLEELSTKSQYPYRGVKGTDETVVTWGSLNVKIQQNFEKYFWIPQDRNEAMKKFPKDVSVLNRTGIYKDTVNSSLVYTDYQFRPNVLVSMVVAPYLFNSAHANHTLQLIASELEGPFGMATLERKDWNYCGYYNGSDGSDNFNTGNGFNYHQGPEWLWLTGYYLRALITFSQDKTTLKNVDRVLRLKLSHLFGLEESNDWLGLPELTQENGNFCNDSSRIQAWSIGCTIEAINDFYNHHLKP